MGRRLAGPALYSALGSVYVSRRVTTRTPYCHDALTDGWDRDGYFHARQALSGIRCSRFILVIYDGSPGDEYQLFELGAATSLLKNVCIVSRVDLPRPLRDASQAWHVTLQESIEDAFSHFRQVSRTVYPRRK